MYIDHYTIHQNFKNYLENYKHSNRHMGKGDGYSTKRKKLKNIKIREHHKSCPSFSSHQRNT